MNKRIKAQLSSTRHIRELKLTPMEILYQCAKADLTDQNSFHADVSNNEK